MKILVINGTEYKGCTFQIKESFLMPLRQHNEIKEYELPRDCPHFCTGCKACFQKSEHLCPHAGAVEPIWQDMLAADLLVFAYPVYGLRTTGQMKALLDHLCVHWMVHRPDPRMFTKRAVILTNSIGAPNGAAQKDVATSLTWLGVSHIRRLGFGLMEGIIWHELSTARREKIQAKARALGERCQRPVAAGKSLKIRLLFQVCKMLQKRVLKKQATPSADAQHWLDQGWL